jgi:O-antigen/teichoic acid export membrane protein
MLNGSAENTASSTLIGSLLRSSALRAAAALGLSGLALACGNLMLARALPTVELARFALLFSIVQIGISIGPIGADVILARGKFAPTAKLHGQILLTSAATAALMVLISARIYSLRADLLAAIFLSIVAGGVKTLAVAHYRSLQRFGVALMLTVTTNAALLLASTITVFAHWSSALLPAATMAISLAVTAVLAWRAVANVEPDDGATVPYTWSERWAAVSFISAGMILATLDRLVTPRLLGLPELATLSVLVTIAGSPFQMLQLGVGYTLLPVLRGAPDQKRRRQVFGNEALVIGATCLAAAIAVWWLTPFILMRVLAGRYEIAWPLLLAAIAVGFLKVIASLVAAVVNALGSASELQRLSVAGWLSVAVALFGGALGAHWGLAGLVFGVGSGWLFRVVATTWLAAPHLRATSHPHDHLRPSTEA